MVIKTEKTKNTIFHLKIWFPKNITVEDVRRLLKEKHLTAYHMWTRDPMYVAIMYKNKTEYEKAKMFVKQLEKLGNEKAGY